jgi:phosphatidylserine decarboxylase
MSFAREGLPFIVGFIVVTVAAYTLALTRSSVVLWILAAVLTLLSVWVAYFFRDPERDGPRGPELVIAPADGRIVTISEVDEPAFLHGRALRVSIFMNVLNVHVNRYPASGTVRYMHYNKGRFLHAASEKASLDNEQMSVGIQVGDKRVLVRQIAGFIARRIVNYAREGESVEQAERMGLIRFGSRVDLFVPLGTDLRVKAGELTTAGVTVIGGLAP